MTRPLRRAVCRGFAAAGLTVMLFAVTVGRAGAVVEPTTTPFTVHATSLTTASLTYTGTTSVGPVTALTFTLDGATLAGYGQTTPCEAGAGGVLVQQQVTSPGVALEGAVSLVATSLAYDGLAQPWTPANPPPSGVVSGPFTHVSIAALSLSAPTLTGAIAADAVHCP